MRVTKRKLAELNKPYAVCSMDLNGATHFLAATEDHGKCLMFAPPDWSPSTVWSGPGGVMSLVPLPFRPRSLLAIERFFPIFRSEAAGIILAQAGENVLAPWCTRRVLDLPFVHRIEVVPVGGHPCLVAATLCAGKSHTDDWSQPGAIYAGLCPEAPRENWHVEPILTGITKNHGMHVTRIGGRLVVLVAGEEGLFALEVPAKPDEPWRSRRLSDRAVSDIYCIDLDGDGQLELAAIEPFHGNSLSLYRFCPDGLERLWDMPLDFGHVIWMGSLLSRPSLIVGNRGGDRDLTLLHPRLTGRKTTLDTTVLDRDVGPTQIVLARASGANLILSANHAANEVALYHLAG